MSMKFREVNCFESGSVINFRYVIQSLSRSWLNYVTDFVYNKIKQNKEQVLWINIILPHKQVSITAVFD